MKAQNKVEASVGADLVSGYIWRGQDLGGVSIQPSLGISYKGFHSEYGDQQDLSHQTLKNSI